MVNPIFNSLDLISVTLTGKVALVSLFRPSDPDLLAAEELAKEIRRKIDASSLSSSWMIEKITILDENESAMKVLSSQKPNKATVA